jgi:hypothetical protein
MDTELAGDLLHGAQAIGEVLYGRNDPHAARKVYNNQDRLPVFKLGNSSAHATLRYSLVKTVFPRPIGLLHTPDYRGSDSPDRTLTALATVIATG